jgi:hypothetical protein
MKRREFLVRLGELSLLGMSVSLSGCISSDSSATGSSNSELADTADTVATTEPQATATATPTTTTSASSLAGTCPKGKSCTHAECQLWSDLNSNGMCDRGYRES